MKGYLELKVCYYLEDSYVFYRINKDNISSFYKREDGIGQIYIDIIFKENKREPLRIFSSSSTNKNSRLAKELFDWCTLGLKNIDSDGLYIYNIKDLQQ